VSSAEPNTYRIAIGPVNYSNQATMWAKALRESRSDISSANFAIEVPGGFDFPADLVVPLAFYQRSRQWQLAQAEALSAFTHLLVEAEEALLGRLFRRSIDLEQHFFSEAGLKLAYVAHGTDIRVPQLHAQRTKWSPYLDSTTYWERSRKVAEKNTRFLQSISAPVFVSTPDLLLDLPEAIWCPVVIDIDVWSTSNPPQSSEGPLKVVHVPSAQSMKGTQLIEPHLFELAREGIIDYQPISGVSSKDMPGVIEQADVVLDQFRLGSYGVAACEAMAMGKPVLGHVLPEVRDIVFNISGLSLPIVEATPESISSVLVGLAQERTQLEAIGTEGANFVRSIHSGAWSANQLINNWIFPGITTSHEGSQL
jgi:hypothetical protein